MSVWDWLQNKHEWNSPILLLGTENNKDLENKLWHLTALGRGIFCTCPWCFIRTFELIWTFIHGLCCICMHCFIPRGVLWSNLNSVRPPSLRLAHQNLKVRSELRSGNIIQLFPLFDSLWIIFVQLEETVTHHLHLNVRCWIHSVCKFTSSSCWSAV